MTCALLSELVKRKIKVIFCDEKYNPESELTPYYGSFDCSKQLKKQIAWTEDRKASCWQHIVERKIVNQALLLKEFDEARADMLLKFAGEVLPFDKSNREGHAAKVYFNTLFGNDFSRSSRTGAINAKLNYGYAILLSSFNREIVSNGYNTCLGISHCSEFNQFNLACDMMEPFRPEVDKLVLVGANTPFDVEEKHRLVGLLSVKVPYGGQNVMLTTAIRYFVKEIIEYLNGERDDNFERLPDNISDES